LSKKPLTPTKKEISQNVRSRSAKLRYAIRNNNSFFYPDEFKKKFQNFFKIEEQRL
jgi:Predicted S-adenosylmethionine-dependent methyltransferase involved in cell envelope biogenesis